MWTVPYNKIKSEILTYSKFNVHTTENEFQEEVQALHSWKKFFEITANPKGPLSGPTFFLI